MNQRALLGIIAALLLVVGLLIGLLVGGGGDGDDTATATDTTTTAAAPTTTAAVTETTAAPTTTAAVTETTTTTTTTTTLPPVTGVFVASEGVLGWVTDGVVSSVDDGPVPATAGDEFRLVGPTGVTGTATGTAVEPGCFGETPYVDLGIVADSWPFDFPLGVSGSWDLFPQMVESLPTDNPTYVDATRELMASYGIDDPNPQLLQVLRVDLEGDGVDEVIVVAERLQSGQLIGAVEGDYGVVFMRKLIEGEVQTAILGRSQVDALAEGEFGFVEVWRVPAILDLDGDGQMEIVTQGFYYEGSWTEAWEYVNDDLGPVVSLVVGCGA